MKKAKKTATQVKKDKKNDESTIARKSVLTAMASLRDTLDDLTDPSLMDKRAYKDLLEELLTEVEFRLDAVETELEVSDDSNDYPDPGWS